MKSRQQTPSDEMQYPIKTEIPNACAMMVSILNESGGGQEIGSGITGGVLADRPVVVITVPC